MSRQKVICDGKGGGERVLERGATRRYTTDGEAVGQKRKMKRSRKLVETGGAGGLK